MDSLNYIHNDETRKNWENFPLTYQMGNIGSEVSRSLKWSSKGPAYKARADRAIDRALELFDFTIEANVKNPARLTEILKARDEFCDYFFNNNSYHTNPIKMQKYYDEFVIMGQKLGQI